MEELEEDKSPPADAHTNQVKAIKSQRGVANSGPIRKNNLILDNQQ